MRILELEKHSFSKFQLLLCEISFGTLNKTCNYFEKTRFPTIVDPIKELEGAPQKPQCALVLVGCSGPSHYGRFWNFLLKLQLEFQLSQLPFCANFKSFKLLPKIRSLEVECSKLERSKPLDFNFVQEFLGINFQNLLQ